MIGCWLVGILFALLVPGGMKWLHDRRQDHLVERCRALYMHAVQALRLGDTQTAHESLDAIRQIEARWRAGRSTKVKIALACVAVGIGFAGNLAIRYAALLLPVFGDRQPVNGWSDLVLLAASSLSGVTYSLVSYLGAWGSPWLVDDCGDRLEKLLRGTKSISVRPGEGRSIRDGLRDREVLGVPPAYTRKDLDAARRRLAATYHPDKWMQSDPGARAAAEAAMKRVNAAYDALKAGA